MPIDISALARLGAQMRIAELIAEIESLVHAFPGLGKAPARIAKPTESGRPVRRKRRKMSVATKAKIKAAWARRRGGAERTAPQTADNLATEAPAKKRRTISAAGRARIAAAQRKRWASIRKAKNNE
jgi:hypothetical protein